MKRSILFFIALMIVSYLQAAVIEHVYYTGSPKITVQAGFQSITFANTMNSGLAGEPSLPYFAVSLLLPPGERAESMTFTGEEETLLPGNYLLFPYQPSWPLSDTTPAKFLQDQEIYKSKLPYPSDQRGHLLTQFMNGHSFALSTFTPVIYQPSTGKISYYRKVTIRIRTTKDENSGAALRNLNQSPDVLQRVRGLAQNPEMAFTYPSPVYNSDAYQLLIISPAQFLQQFQGLIKLYFIRGLKTRVLSLDSIYAQQSGVDNPEKIRNCIIQEYQLHQVSQVLLAGDIELMPYRGLYATVNSTSFYVDNGIPGDIYFSALDGNWNANGNNLWGEAGEEDLLPEISVGRLPANNPSELSRMLHKTIMYQANPVVSELRKPLLAGEWLYANPLTYGSTYMNLLIGHHSDNGYVTEGIPGWHHYDTLYDNTSWSWTAADMIALLNEGHPFLHHVGHASTNYLFKMGSSQVTEATFAPLNGTTHNYLPVYSHGCYCAQFDANECIAENMLSLQNFCNAFIGNSRYGWFNEGTSEGPSEHLHREFLNVLYADHDGSTGMAHTISKIKAAPWTTAPGQWEEGALRWCVFDCNVLGDPAMQVWTDYPMNLQVSYPPVIHTSDTTLNITVDTSNTPVMGIMCTIIRDSSMLYAAKTDSLGQVHFHLSLLPADTGTVRLYVSGYNCLPDSFSIHILPSVSSITGKIYYTNTAHTGLRNVVVKVFLNNTIVAQTNTDTTGHYQFTGLPAGNYSLKVEISKPWGGVNSTDALLILKHFACITPLQGLKLKAADVNGNQFVNSVDALMAQRRFVNFITSFAAGDWLTEDKTVTATGSGDVHNVDVGCLCYGDVNGSYVP